MVAKRKAIKVSEALSKLMEFGGEPEAEIVSLIASDGRFLAEDLTADHDIPPFDRSPYDGFAVRAEDTNQASTHSPTVLRVVGEIAAGSVFPGEVQEGEAVRIMTGAQIPENCNAVVMLEAVKEVVVNGEPHIHVRRPMKENANISFAGEDIKRGNVIAEKGQLINPGIIALLATFGYSQVAVCKKPKVGILATGSELLEVTDGLEPGKIRNSNGYMIYSQAMRAGSNPVFYGKLNDDFDDCLHKVTEVLNEVDILITTGGVSVGDYDYMPAILKEMSANVLFNKVAMRPGSVTTVAEKKGKLIFALSGNPSACYVGFELFTRPIIRKLLHFKHPHLKTTTAILGADFPKKNPFDRFVRSFITYENGQLVATPTGLDKSGVVSSLAKANALIIFHSGKSGYQKGMHVQVLLLNEQEGSSIDEFNLGNEDR
ncbi:molybdopterin molybdotransferase MoeA [Oceanobacillus sp. CAU 1775]